MEENALQFLCPGCGAAMEYSIQKQMLHCSHCDTCISVEEWTQQWMKKEIGGDPSMQYDDDTYRKIVKDSKNAERKRARIQVRIARCASCGAELAADTTEATSYCCYCGQAAVLQDRVDDMLEPDYIIPFRITKDEAEAIIRKNLAKGKYVPAKIKEFETERLVGVYVPYWLFDINYFDDQYWRYDIGTKKSKYKYNRRAAECDFEKITVDGVARFDDEVADRLEPFDLKELVPFDAAYLSGMYADRFDEGAKEKEERAVLRAKRLFDAEVGKTTLGELYASKPRYEVKNVEYAFLPVWFLTFRHANKKYTVLVNGQTGKMVGAVPWSGKKAFLSFLWKFVLFCIPSIYFCRKIFFDLLVEDAESIFAIVGLAFVFILCLVFVACLDVEYKKLKRDIRLSESESNDQYAGAHHKRK